MLRAYQCIAYLVISLMTTIIVIVINFCSEQKHYQTSLEEKYLRMMVSVVTEGVCESFVSRLN